MESFDWHAAIQHFDDRRNIVIPGDANQSVIFAVKQFIQIGQHAIDKHGFFTVALSGGHTPIAIFRMLTSEPYKSQLDWTKVRCFWSDERCVPPTDPQSNYHMAMEAGIDSLPIPKNKIFRMEAEQNTEESAEEYERHIKRWVPSGSFDLIMLGVGEDGHTASLFPRTHALHTKNRFVASNEVPQKQTTRMTFTFDCLNAAKHVSIYALGSNKADIVAKVLTSPFNPDHYPVQKVGTTAHPALWILDKEAAHNLSLAHASSRP